MKEKNIKRIIIAIKILTLIICLLTLTYIIIPHHITESQAIKYGKDFMIENINDSRVEVYYEAMTYVYMTSDGKEINQVYQRDTSFIERIKNHWNPELRYYYVGFKTNVSKTAFYLEVDGYTNYVQEGDPAIRWENFKEKANQMQ